LSYHKAFLFAAVVLVLLAGSTIAFSSPAAVHNEFSLGRSQKSTDFSQAPQQTEQENPFLNRAEVDFYQARALMRDFKIVSLVLFLIGGFIAVLFCRRYLHTRLPETPIFVLITAFFIQYVVLCVLNIGLYIFAVHYEWFGYNLLDRAVNDSSLWPEIQKTLSLGLGSFYVAHLIDAFIASLVIFSLMTISIALAKGKAR